MNDIIKFLGILAIVGGPLVATGVLWQKVEAHEGKLSTIEQMAVDIAVMKSRLEWLVERKKQEESRTLRR